MPLPVWHLVEGTSMSSRKLQYQRVLAGVILMKTSRWPLNQGYGESVSGRSLPVHTGTILLKPVCENSHLGSLNDVSTIISHHWRQSTQEKLLLETSFPRLNKMKLECYAVLMKLLHWM